MCGKDLSDHGSIIVLLVGCGSCFLLLMVRPPTRSTPGRSSAASGVYKGQVGGRVKYHGISQEGALAEGVDIKEALSDYKHDIDNHCSLLVCHNMTFDKTVVVSELMRLNMTVNNVNECCTMLDTINYCKLMPMVRGGYKWASLEQLYRKCFNAEIENAHNSYYDVVNTAKCYFAVKK